MSVHEGSAATARRSAPIRLVAIPLLVALAVLIWIAPPGTERMRSWCFDVYQVIEITADSQTELVCNRFHHLAEIAVRRDRITRGLFFHAPAINSNGFSSHNHGRRASCIGVRRL